VRCEERRDGTLSLAGRKVCWLAGAFVRLVEGCVLVRLPFRPITELRLTVCGSCCVHQTRNHLFCLGEPLSRKSSTWKPAGEEECTLETPKSK